MARQQRWKSLLPFLMILSLMASFWTPQSANAADDGVNVSTVNKTYSIASAVSFDGQKVCVVWSRFDEDPQAFIRVFNVTGNSWNPPLGSAPFQLSVGGFSGVESTKCAFDTTGALHAVWQQKEGGPFEIVSRSLPNGGDPSNASNWGAVTTVDGNGDGSDISAFQPDNTGRVWLVHRKYQGPTGSQLYVRSRQNGNWSAPAIFTASGAAGSPRVAVDNLGYVHLAWKNGNSGRGYAYYNSNNGTFSAEVGIPGSNNSGNFSMTVNRDNGDVHVVYSKNFNELHYAKKNGASSTTFNGDTIIAYADNRALDPQITWSPARLIIAFDSGDKARIDYITSTDQGGSWSGATTLSSPGGGAQSPWVVADDRGNGYVAYAHRGDGTVYFVTLGSPTVPPVITAGPTVAPLGCGVGATITWTTQVSGTSVVEYGLTGAYGSTASGGVGTAHSVALTELQPGATYYYRVRSTNDAGTAQGPAAQFTVAQAAYSCWVSQGGVLTDSPAVAAFNGKLYVFAVGTDPQDPAIRPLYVKSSVDGATWSGWSNLGGNLTAAPAAAAFNGRLYAFAKGVDGATFPLYAKSSADGAGFGEWQNLGGDLTAAPAAAVYTPPGGLATLVVAARGSDGAAYLKASTDGTAYGDWADLGGQLVGAPAVVGLGDRLYLLVRWATNELYERHTLP